MTTWHIYYRGSLSSCNYACDYCPFAKTGNTRAQLRQDQAELERFVEWAEKQSSRLGILITPWGEALGHRYYRRALTRLSHFPQVYRISIQTNLSAPLGELADARRDSLALWTTFHPRQTSLKRFIARCRQLDQAHIRYSVGVVGLHEHFEAIEQLRQLLDPRVYLWVNAFKRHSEYYQPQDIQRLLAIDPYFHWNLHRYPSAGTLCRAGESSFAVDGQGDMRRCHFVSPVIGNIYEEDFARALRPRPCTAAHCGCHIGYIHRPQLQLDGLYGSGLVERIPPDWPVLNSQYTCAAKAAPARLTQWEVKSGPSSRGPVTVAERH